MSYSILRVRSQNRSRRGKALTAEYGNPVAIAKRIHLYPSRTQKLSSLALKILGGQPPGKLGRRRFFFLRRFHYGIFFFYVFLMKFIDCVGAVL